MTRRRRHRTGAQLHTAIGIAIIALLIVGVYVSYNSIHGLPLQSVYDVTVDVPNADRLVATDEVRIYGVLSGSVASVAAVPGTTGRGGGRGPFTRIELHLDSSVKRLPADTRVKIGLSSALGATYVNLIPGRSRQTVPPGGQLPLKNAEPTVDLVDLFDIFNSSTRQSIQRTTSDLGEGLAGQGPSLNVTIGGLDRMLAPFNRVAATLAAPATRLGSFLHAYESFIAAMTPVASPLAQLLGNGATTFGALVRAQPAYGATLDALPPTEAAVTSGFTRIQPALTGLAALVTDLRPGGALLPGALALADQALAAGVQPLRQTPPFAAALSSTLNTIRSVTRMPSTDGAVRKLGDLVNAVHPLLAVLTPAQEDCDVISLFGIQFAKVFGNGGGGEQAMATLGLASGGAEASIFQHAKPSADLGVDYLPQENAGECASGNEPAPGLLGPPQLSSPTGTGRAVPATAPPPGVEALAERAGLLNAPAGTPR